MAVQPTFPGVYVQEIPSGVRTIAGVSTSIALFIGQGVWGPVNEPVLCLSYTDFDRAFTSDTSRGDLARAVRLFFLNGGTLCYVLRIAREGDAVPANNAVKATVSLLSGATPLLDVTAKSEGVLGNTIRVVVEQPPSPPAAPMAFNLIIFRLVKNKAGEDIPTDSQTYTGLSMDPLDPRYAPNYVSNSWVNVTLSAGAPLPPIRPDASAAGPPVVPSALAGGTEGAVLVAADYDAVYPTLEKEIDLFNLMILPRNSTGVAVEGLWGNASVFCQKKRAFLLMDPPGTWTTVQQATDPGAGVSALRTGLVNAYSAVFFPRLTLTESTGDLNIGPGGAIAGLMARIDASRGVWKAPAGTEADLRGITGLQYKFTDDENGVLNQRAVNTIRIFPNGIVNWGARTMDGDNDFGSEYKYIPVRRTALFIEESLYRGLKWVVFEPNDEPLWSQIRLNVGAFMHDLFRQGAFQGKTKQDAYFVKCDSETTTQNDINLGVVNVLVGFAPLKPAEFVILTLQQMAGQIQV
ncbi:MAG TPA: phage tail sheath C-terminal domain-containing protein [Puia sp.]|nr:phage tail sheath C-terminal domain-containing protein [Puia sp.]